MTTHAKGPRGAPDVLPPDSELLTRLEDAARVLLDRYGFRRIQTPAFEHTEVFTRSVGDAADIVVKKEMYTFQDRSGRSLTLRPEGTAPIVRAYVEHKMWGDFPPPVKLYEIGPMFRYERPQEGRTRQFVQIDLEAFGSFSPLIDAEIMTLGAQFYASLGLEPALLLNSMGCRQDRERYFPRLRAGLQPRIDEMCGDCHVRLERSPLRVFDCKIPQCRQILENLEPVSAHLCDECRTHLEQTKALLESASVKWDDAPMLVRGFDYYTRTVFEFDLATLGARSAVGGGGRYDYLVEQFGGPPTPAIGMAVGVEPTMVALRKLSSSQGYKPDFFVAWLSPELRETAYKVSTALRDAGRRVAMSDEPTSLNSQMKRANRSGALRAVILGPDEFSRNAAAVRDMASGEQTEVALSTIQEL